jgi:hypothetical protein
MGRIKKKEVRLLDDEEEESISYCQRCLKIDIYSTLQERIYLHEVTNDYDRGNWKQCHNCGQSVPIYETPS